MGDVLLEIGKNDAARKVVSSLGLPLSLPQDLARTREPWGTQPLREMDVAVAHPKGAELAPVLAQTLCSAGANCYVAAEGKAWSAYEAEGTAWARIPRAMALDTSPDNVRFGALVFDATGVRKPADLKAMYTFFHARVRNAAACGRVLILGPAPEDMPGPEAAATARALEGFMRSVGKETGKKGITANLITVEKGAQDRVDPVVRFFLSPRSAFVSGQPVRVSKTAAAPQSASYERPLDGKVALVTGAARGIGEEIARCLAGEGARVVCMDRPQEEDRTASLARELSGTALLCDITADDSAAQILDHVKKFHGGRLDIVVHNAGVTRDKMLQNMDEGRWDMVLDINLMSIVRVTDALLKELPKEARIVCLSSMAGIAGNVGQTNYAATKAGLIGFVRALSSQVAKKGITVNAVAPGFIETQMTAAIPFATREAGRRLSSLGQGGLPLDVAQLVTFLCLPQACGVTGETVRICGQGFLGA